jgi:hypothetical protein
MMLLPHNQWRPAILLKLPVICVPPSVRRVGSRRIAGWSTRCR